MPKGLIMRYETTGMWEIRKQMKSLGFSDAEVDTFKGVLANLERRGWRLRKVK